MRLKIILMGIVAAAVLAVGCGGGDDGSTSAGTDSGATSSTTTNTNAEESGNDGQEEGGSTTQSDETTGKEEGDSTTQSEEATGPLSKKEFIAKGDAICETVPKRYGVKVKGLEKEAKAQGKSKPSAAETNLKAALPPLFIAIEELDGLIPPTGDEQTAESIVDALEAAAKGVEEKPSSPLTGPKSPFVEFVKLTKGYGFKVCPLL